jgi:hypothetical protein
VPLDSIPALRVAGKRAPRARYPNIVDMEAAGSLGALEGFISRPVQWLEPDFAKHTPGVNHLSTASDWPVNYFVKFRWFRPFFSARAL